MATYEIEEIFQVALEAGFTPAQATTWTAIALAESGGRLDAVNDQGEDSRGLWQVNIDPGVRTNEWGDLSDPRINAQAAYDISHGGTDMRPWTTTHEANRGTAHDYRTYLDDVEAAVGVPGDWSGVSGYHAPAPEPEAAPSVQAQPAQQAHQDVTASTMVTAGMQTDTDRDGLTDALEQAAGSDPTVADTDADGLGDAVEVGVVHSDPTAVDTDSDGLSDAREFLLGTDPTRADTDADGLTDAAEDRFGTDPLQQDAGEGVPLEPTEPPPTMTSPGAPTPTPTPAPTPVPPTTMGPDTVEVTYHPYDTGDTGNTGNTGNIGDGGTDGTAWETPTSTADGFVDAALEQFGDPYVFAVSAEGADPTAFDCSELTQWAAGQVGVELAESSQEQYLDLKAQSALISVDEALHTKGALLFYFPYEPTGGTRPPGAHVAISLGDGRTVEANPGTGVTVLEAGDRFTYAGVVPGITDTAVVPPAEPPAPLPAAEPPAEPAGTGYDLIDAGLPPDQSTDSDDDGLTDAFEALAGTDPMSADSDADALSDGYEAMVSRTDPLSTDTDDDGVSDAQELTDGTEAGAVPGVAYVVGRGEFAENIRHGFVDTDGDGLSDTYETRTGLDPSSADSDGDGLSDAWEMMHDSNALLVDSDADGLTDGFEQSAASSDSDWSS